MKIPVVYSQHDIRWNNLKLGGSNSTIGMYGCTITAYSMLSEYYGHHITPSGFNSVMLDKNLYVGAHKNLYSMTAITKIYPDIKYNGLTNTNGNVTPEQFALIHQEIDNKRPVVIKLKTSGGYHYVLAINYTGQGLEIADPRDGQIRTLRSKYGADRFAIYRYVFHTGTLVNNKMPTLDFSQGSILAKTGGKFNASIGLAEIIEQNGGNVVIQAFWPDGSEFKQEVPFHELTLVNRDTKSLETKIEQQQITLDNTTAQLKTIMVSELALKERCTVLDEMLIKTKADVKREIEANGVIREKLLEATEEAKRLDGELNKVVKQVIDYSDTLKKERDERTDEKAHYTKKILELENKLLPQPSLVKQITTKITDFILKIISRWKKLKV